MSTLNFPFIPKKEPRKRRPNHFMPLNLQPFFFLFLLSMLSMKISNADPSQITLTIQGNSDQRLINDAFATKISKVWLMEMKRIAKKLATNWEKVQTLLLLNSKVKLQIVMICLMDMSILPLLI